MSNPFNLRVAGDIAKTIAADLAELGHGGEDGDRTALNPKFFTHPLSRIELVGIVNRIDRQFIKDIVPGSENHDRCGEISVIYRFSYSLQGGDVAVAPAGDDERRLPGGAARQARRRLELPRGRGALGGGARPSGRPLRRTRWWPT